MNYAEFISAYETDAQFPDVSGMEHLELLMTHSEIARHEARSSQVERQRAQRADHQLLRHAKQFYASIQAVADLVNWRSNENTPVAHWWWYLDVITQLPLSLDPSTPTPQFALELSPAP
jgi:hypothetical protein